MNGYIKFEGYEIKGEAIDDQHVGEVEILSFSVGADSPTSMMGQHFDSTRAKATASPFTFTKHFDNATPQLLLALAESKKIKKAIVTLQRSSGDKTDFLTYTFENVIITSISTSGSAGGGGGGLPVESVSFIYDKQKVEYTPEKPDGSMGDPNSAGWNWAEYKPL